HVHGEERIKTVQETWIGAKVNSKKKKDFKFKMAGQVLEPNPMLELQGCRHRSAREGLPDEEKMPPPTLSSTKKRAAMDVDGKIGCDGIGVFAGFAKSGCLIEEEEADIAGRNQVGSHRLHRSLLGKEIELTLSVAEVYISLRT
ncbi:hypothetical protein ACLOJK_006562, partial [Asimina triloba]